MTEQPIKTGVAVREQPSYKTCQYCGAGRVVRPSGEWQYACHCDEKIPQPNQTEQPKQNAMIFEQIEGYCGMIEKLLSQIIPKTTNVEDCVITHKAWQDNNLKHLKAGFE